MAYAAFRTTGNSKKIKNKFRPRNSNSGLFLELRLSDLKITDDLKIIDIIKFPAVLTAPLFAIYLFISPLFKPGRQVENKFSFTIATWPR
jgi:hypothetical protein